VGDVIQLMLPVAPVCTHIQMEVYTCWQRCKAV
jgi:hypothetical protein